LISRKPTSWFCFSHDTGSLELFDPNPAQQFTRRLRRVVLCAARKGIWSTMPEMQQQQHLLLPSSIAAAAAPEAQEHNPPPPESIPPWVHVNDGDEQAPLFAPPAPVVPNTRHYKPPSSNLKPGKRLDQYRSAEPGLLSAPIDEHQARWAPFMQSSPVLHEQRDVRIIRSPQWMEENVPISSRVWEPEDEVNPEATRRLGGLQGIMLGGKWLISPERQERTVKFFWVSETSCEDCHFRRYII
jgi:hypothetical protein